MHHNTGATERDMTHVFEKIFEDPRLPSDLVGARARAEANLFTILSVSSLFERRYSSGFKYLVRAIRKRPSRPLRFLLASLSRFVRTRRTTTEAESRGRSDWLADSATHSVWESAYRTTDVAEFYEVAFDWLATRFPRLDSVLDIGCGSGAHSIRLAERGFSVEGIDISEAALAVGREKISAAGLDTKIATHREDLLSLSMADGSADCVLCWGVLMHVPELDRALAELRRVMSRGGVLVLSEVNARAPEAVAIRLVNRLKDRGRVSRAEIGFELTRSDGAAAGFTRHCDMTRLVQVVERNGFRLDTRRAGQLTELYSRTTSRRARALLASLNVWWFQHEGPSALAVGNILVFTAVP
jgi:2-polyprenyl-3-methyl-5-hydroxy-6-metoxy-1,4-benzoquinol methylase